MSHDTGRPIRRHVGGGVALWLLTLLAVMGLGRVDRAAGHDDNDTDGIPSRAVLDLPMHGSLTGEMLDVPAEAVGGRTTFLWRSPVFVEPFEFAVDSVVGIRFPQPAEGREWQAVGDWRIELTNGDQIVAGIESIDERQVVAVMGSGVSPTRLAVPRDAVAGIFRGAPAAVTAAPGSLGGTRATLMAGERLTRDLKAGPRGRYDIALSWQERPTMRIAFGVGGDEKTPFPYRLELGSEGMVAVREEDGTDGETGARADLQPCGELPENGLRLTVYIDDQAGRMAVILPDAQEPIADLTIPPGGGKAGGGIHIAVAAGQASLDSLRLTPWQGGQLLHGGRQEGEISLRDGESLAAVVERMEPGTDTILVRTAESAVAGAPRRIALDEVGGILFPSAGKGSAEQTTDAHEETVGRSVVQATDLAGSRLTGRLLQVGQGTVWIGHPAVAEPVPLPIATLAAIAGPVSPAAPPTLSGRIGRLDCGQETVWGCLVNGAGAGKAEAKSGPDGAAAAAIRWQPLGSLTASPLAPVGDGGQPQATITYSDKSKKDAADAAGTIGGIGAQVSAVPGQFAVVVGVIPDSAAERAGVLAGEMIVAIAPRGDGRFVDTAGLTQEDAHDLLRGRVGDKVQIRLRTVVQNNPRQVTIVRQELAQFGRNPQVLKQALQTQDRLLPQEVVPVDPDVVGRFESSLILRTGETFPCRVEAIDETGVLVQVSGNEPVKVAADLVQAVELVPAPGREVSAEKFRSLTTLPRSQRQQPPTHVLRSVQGDYLRGRLVAMDAETIRITVEASPQAAPLSIPRVQVARLIWLHPENLDTPWQPSQTMAGRGLLVESVGSGNDRLRMLATGIEGNRLVGTSPWLGPCGIDLEKTDRLLIGGARDDSPQPFPYAQWKLLAAPEPRNLPPRKP